MCRVYNRDAGFMGLKVHGQGIFGWTFEGLGFL